MRRPFLSVKLFGNGSQDKIMQHEVETQHGQLQPYSHLTHWTSLPSMWRQVQLVLQVSHFFAVSLNRPLWNALWRSSEMRKTDTSLNGSTAARVIAISRLSASFLHFLYPFQRQYKPYIAPWRNLRHCVSEGQTLQTPQTTAADGGTWCLQYCHVHLNDFWSRVTDFAAV